MAGKNSREGFKQDAGADKSANGSQLRRVRLRRVLPLRATGQVDHTIVGRCAVNLRAGGGCRLAKPLQNLKFRRTSPTS